MNVIAVLNSKGGVGKTTLTAMLAVRAAQEAARVAIVDLDPQRSITQWWERRGSPGNIVAFDRFEDAPRALEALAFDSFDWVFIDGPPAWLTLLDEAVKAAHVTLIPIKASMLDILATQDAVVLARAANAPFLVVLSDTHHNDRALTASARNMLAKAGLTLAETEMKHRGSYIRAMTVGKSAAELDCGKDKEAAKEIDALWSEVKSMVASASEARERSAES